MFTKSLFGSTPRKDISIPSDCDIVFVSDFFIEDHIGGAELTTEAIIEKSPYKVFKLRSSTVSLDLIKQGSQKYWVFGNFSGVTPNLYPNIVSSLKYSIIEYDYKYCSYRSPEKHAEASKEPCDCHNKLQGKMVSALLYGTESLFWMSEKQMQRYHQMFPFLSDKRNTILSSVFSDNFFTKIENFRKNSNKNKSGWLVVGSNSWIKGVENCEEWCRKNNKDYEVLWNISHDEVLEKMSNAEGLCFLPPGGDTCPRTTIEAKLLGCDLRINNNVQHASEKWFDTDDIESIENYLKSAGSRIWGDITKFLERQPKISGYTTTLNCIDQGYPLFQCIASLLGFCDEVVIVDGGSTDGTWEELETLANLQGDGRIIIHQQKRDWDHPRFAVFDGMQKALARSLCTSEFCWQQDSDEIVHENDYEKIKAMVKKIPEDINLICMPVVEYWGNTGKVRIDVNPWKWRLSRNRPHITHGVPRDMRTFSEEGDMFATLGTDGCDYIRSDTFDRIPHATFYTKDADELRMKSFEDDLALEEYQKWMNEVINGIPPVYHYSWFRLGRKIRTYRDYWSNHWKSLYNIEQEDTVENNMFFNKQWSDVTEEEIDELSERLSSEMGGWIFHSKVDFNKSTPHIVLNVEHPKVMNDWIEK